jgi:hypothetical protein
MEKYNKQEQYKYTYSREQYKHTSYRNNAKQLITGTIQNTNYREKYKILITGKNTRIQHTWNNTKYNSYMEQYK